MVKRAAAGLLAILALASLPLAPVSAAPTPPPSPTGLLATYDNATQALTLSWTMPPGHDPAAYTYSLYRNGIELANGTATSYVDGAYDPFSLYWVTAHASTGSSLPSSPVGFVSCQMGNCADASQLVAWTVYPMASTTGACVIVTVQFTPLGGVIYWDCIRNFLQVPRQDKECTIHLHLDLDPVPTPRCI